MKRKWNSFRYLSALLVMVAAGSCRVADTLSEDEIIDFDRQNWSYTLRFLDPYLDVVVPDLDVEVSVGGEVLSLTSNADGTIHFLAPFNNQFEVSVTGQGYFSIRRRFTPFNESNSERSKDIFETFVLFPEADYGTFTVQGKAEVQSNLITAAREAATGARFSVIIETGSGDFVVPVVAGADGRYKTKLPAFPQVSYRFIYETYSANQTLAINRLANQPAFPQTLPSIVQIETTFDPTFGSVISVPFVRPVFATLSDNPTGPGALKASLAINGNISSGGVITFVLVSSSGLGYPASSTTLPVTVTSLEGGSGAIITANTNVSGQVTSLNLTDGGLGYPAFNSNTNKVSNQLFTADLPNNTFLGFSVVQTFKPGAIIVNDIYYGTGSSRVQAVN
ncbi:MAG: hypothetical protein KDC99_03180 [Cyclobacteriaceae bacterium]|nr:hypothetical protein [Cyclobacteriaceae bacterium]